MTLEISQNTPNLLNPSAQLLLWFSGYNGVHFEFYIDKSIKKICLRIQTINSPKFSYHVKLTQKDEKGKSIFSNFMKINMEPAKFGNKNDFTHIIGDLVRNEESKTVVKFSCRIKLLPINNTISMKFTTKILDDLSKLNNSLKFYDFSFRFLCQKTIPVHKFVLASRSPVFFKMLQADMLESNRNEVLIHDADYNVIKIVVNFLYNQEMENFNRYVFDVLVTANKYQIDDLKKHCELEIEKGLTCNIVVDAVIFSDYHCADYLKEKCIQLIHR